MHWEVWHFSRMSRLASTCYYELQILSCVLVEYGHRRQGDNGNLLNLQTRRQNGDLTRRRVSVCHIFPAVVLFDEHCRDDGSGMKTSVHGALVPCIRFGDYNYYIGTCILTLLATYVVIKCFCFDIGDHADTHGREDHEGSVGSHRINVDTGVLQRSLIKLLTLEWLVVCLDKFSERQSSIYFENFVKRSRFCTRTHDERVCE